MCLCVLVLTLIDLDQPWPWPWFSTRPSGYTRPHSYAILLCWELLLKLLPSRVPSCSSFLIVLGRSGSLLYTWITLAVVCVGDKNPYSSLHIQVSQSLLSLGSFSTLLSMQTCSVCTCNSKLILENCNALDLRMVHFVAWWPWPLAFWPLNRFTGYPCDGLPSCQFWAS